MRPHAMRTDLCARQQFLAGTSICSSQRPGVPSRSRASASTENTVSWGMRVTTSHVLGIALADRFPSRAWPDQAVMNGPPGRLGAGAVTAGISPTRVLQ